MLRPAQDAARGRLQAGGWGSRTNLPVGQEGEQSQGNHHHMYMELVAQVWSVKKTTSNFKVNRADKRTAVWTFWQLKGSTLGFINKGKRDWSPKSLTYSVILTQTLYYT